MRRRPYTLIFSAGTSIIGGLKKAGLNLPEGHETAAITQTWTNRQGDGARHLSAELSTLTALDCGSDDQCVLLTTASEPGPTAARLVAHVAKLVIGAGTLVRTIVDLTLDEPDTFRRSGLPGFVTALDRFVGESLAGGREPVIAVGSGVKPVLPYLVLYGMMRRVRCVYVFERDRKLVWLPRLPLSFDDEAVRAGARVLADIEAETSMRLHDLQTRLGNYYSDLEGLFETYDNDVTLSPFGSLVLADQEAASTGVVLLSPRAARTLEQAPSTRRELLSTMLNALRSPQFRATKYHHFERTNLDVWKPGNTPHRVAGWVTDRTTLYVAEIYASHADYGRDLKRRQRNDYDVDNFTTWTPPPEEPPDEGVNVTQLIEAADLRIEQAQKDAETASGTAKEALDRMVRAEAERDKTRADMDTLRNRFAHMGLVQRMRWLLTGRAD